MTLTEAEKTRRLAEGVMGWTMAPETRHAYAIWMDGQRMTALVKDWDPLYNENHAAEVREAMRAKGWWWEILTADRCDHIALEHRFDGVRVTAGKVPPGAIPRGICHAALLALGLATEEEL